MKICVRALALAAAACVSFVVAGSAASATSPSSGATSAGAGRFLGVVPASRTGSRPTASEFAGAAATGGNLVYNGGPVMHTNRTYAIYWVPSGYSVSASYESLINRYFADVAAASGSTSNVYASDTQYYDSTNGNVVYGSTFGGSYTDTNPLPASGCTDKYTSVCLTDAQLRSEIQRVVSAQGWFVGPTSMVFLFTAKGIGSCFDGTSSSCAFSDYCAYHSNIGSGNGEILYANMPYSMTVSSGCSSGQRPNGDDADATLNVTSHEHNEGITDPLGSAWYDSAGNEDGDKCAWNFGSSLGSTGTGAYNQVINGHDYYLQQEWSNASGGCVLTYGNPTRPASTGLPVVSGSVQAGQTLSVSSGTWSGSTPMSFSYQWQRCSSSCVNVGSNSSSYVLSSADVGSGMQVVVTASNSAGSASATSALTATVTAVSGSGKLTVPVASGGDDGDVSVNDMGSGAGYPPVGTPAVWSNGSSFAVRRAGPVNGGYEVRTALLRFDTSTLPVGATITSASLRLTVSSVTSANGRNLVAEWVSGAAWPLDGTDYTATPSTSASMGVAIGSLSAGAVVSLPLQNLGSISTSGWATIRLHVDGGQPNGENNVFFKSYESGAPAQLIINYTTAASAPASTGLPVVSGSVQAGQTLSVSSGTWSGSTPMSFSYQWQRCSSSCVNVGSNSSSYVLSSADVGSGMQVVVTASNSAGSASATSALTATVTAVSGSGKLTVPVASGGDDGDVSVNDMGSGAGYPPVGTPAVWSNGSSFAVRRAGPVNGGYEVRTALLRFDTSTLPVGATITSASLRLTVSSVTSANGRNLVAEWVSGAAWPLDGTDYTATPSTSASMGVAIGSLSAGAVVSLPLQNLGSISTSGWTTIRLHVDGGQPNGENNVFFKSYESGAPAQLIINYTTAASAPASTGLPVVSGSVQAGQTLSVSSGTWSGSTPMSFSYQWQRCSSSCVNVGSNSSSYVLSSADVGSGM